MDAQQAPKDSLEEEMSRFEQEILGTGSSRLPLQPLLGTGLSRPPPQPLLGTGSSRPPPQPLLGTGSSRPPPQPLLGTKPLMRNSPLYPERARLLISPDPNFPGSGSALPQANGGLLLPPNQQNSPRPLFPPGLSTPKPLLPQPTPSNFSSGNETPRPLIEQVKPSSNFVPRQTLMSQTGAPPSVVPPVTTRHPTPLMGTFIPSNVNGPPRMPPPDQNAPPRMPPPGQNAPLRMPPPGQNASPRMPPPGQNAPPRMPPPGQLAPPRMPPPGQNAPPRMPPPGQNAPPRMPPPGQRAPPRMPPPDVSSQFPLHGQQAPPRIPSPGQNVFSRMPPPDFNRHSGGVHSMPPQQQQQQQQTFYPPGIMVGRPAHQLPNPMSGQFHPHQPSPDMQSYSMRPPLATPLPVAIAQAVAGATMSSGMSASGSGGAGVSLDSVPIPRKAPKAKKDPKKLRVGGGKVWEDASLDEWDPNDFRIFVGDLGNDVNDDTLARSFSRFPSFLKARVIRDRYTKKTKGYGFASFRDPKDFMQAMREVNGKYIGNRPVKLCKSTWKDRTLMVVKKKEKEKKRLGFKI